MSNGSKMEYCGNCRFWKEHGDMEMGFCRRRAPAVPMVEPDNIHEHDLWPMTFLEWWCGEWKSKPDDQAPTA
jgi:hypothetical protein